jgi:hypothetical protein
MTTTDARKRAAENQQRPVEGPTTRAMDERSDCCACHGVLKAKILSVAENLRRVHPSEVTPIGIAIELEATVSGRDRLDLLRDRLSNGADS